MQILEEVIKYRWGALPDQQREGIKNYVSNLIIKLSSDDTTFRREKVFLNKLNIILVQVRTHAAHRDVDWHCNRLDGSSMARPRAGPEAGVAAQVAELCA